MIDKFTTISEDTDKWISILREIDLDWDYDINEYMKRSKSYKDFTEEELARISYRFPWYIQPYSCPQLYSHKWRIYTKDLPRKMLETFAEIRHNLDPNEFWFIEKKRITLMEWFTSKNWYTRAAHQLWEWKYEEYALAVELSRDILTNDIAWGSLNGIYNPAATALILWTISQYSNKIKIENMETLQLKEVPDVSKLSTEELMALLQKPLLRQKIFKNQWYGDWKEDEVENTEN